MRLMFYGDHIKYDGLKQYQYQSQYLKNQIIVREKLSDDPIGPGSQGPSIMINISIH